MWGTYGLRNGHFKQPTGVAVATNGYVFVADSGNDRIQFFTAAGSFLGKWGSSGKGNGQFDWPPGVAVRGNGSRVYVVDSGNCRVQYFKESDPAVAPTSLGRIKALFE
jgi:DNA-binding beta-propeller fold protein YncE